MENIHPMICVFSHQTIAGIPISSFYLACAYTHIYMIINIDFTQWKVFGMPVGKNKGDVTDVLDLALHAQMEPACILFNCIPPGSFFKVSPWKLIGTPESHHFSGACKLTPGRCSAFSLKPKKTLVSFESVIFFVDLMKLRALAFIISSSDMSQLLDCPETWGKDGRKEVTKMGMMHGSRKFTPWFRWTKWKKKLAPLLQKDDL